MSEKMKVGKRIYNSMKLEAEKAEAKAATAVAVAKQKRANFDAVECEGTNNAKAAEEPLAASA